MWTLRITSLFLTFACASALSTQSQWTSAAVQQHHAAASASSAAATAPPPSRRAFLTAAFATTALVTNAAPSFAAMAMVSPDEFNIILRDSARSIRVVEFTGPKSETITVRLVDGSSFGIKDIIESSVDPRSPLKISAACRENKVPTKFPELEALLANQSPSKKKIYSNSRVAEAAAKEKDKKIRMEQDEVDRLAALYKQEQGQ